MKARDGGLKVLFGVQSGRLPWSTTICCFLLHTSWPSWPVGSMGAQRVFDQKWDGEVGVFDHGQLERSVSPAKTSKKKILEALGNEW